MITIKLNEAIALLERITKKKIKLVEYIKTTNIQKTINELNAIVNSQYKIAEIDRDTGKRISVFIDGNNLDKINIIIKKANSLGWFPAKVSTGHTLYQPFNEKNLQEIIDDQQSIVILFEKNYDEKKRIDMNQTFYHATPYSNLPQIKKIGLIPKHKDKISSTPPRIYFSTDFESALIITYQLAEYEKDDYIIISIKPSALPENIKFYIDPEYERGIYTYEDIPPQYLQYSKTIPFQILQNLI